ncbi:MAG: glycosyltransferase, partial [Candidatus Omnitrophica bacterium]|nr:glycosyltransferase [Candidatus Omnitrophota bacterium]
MITARPSVTIIIPAYNAEKTIAAAIEAALAQVYAAAIELIVIDDGSTDRTAEIIRRYPTVRYFYQPNAGPASARNLGARHAAHHVLCFTDADCQPHRDWVALLVAGFYAEDIGAVAGSYGIANPGSVLAQVVHFEILFRHTYLMPDHPQAFGSYNVAILRDVFEAVHGFSTDYRRASGEDNDLSYRILNSGKKIFFARQARV